ncbi:sugar kinase [Streptobacillus notomytis]|uniref:sugar kinase n=1 Tax=Streptobacillus notomytis TaxID=1712031 RepID=UPI000937DCF5|nr:sugar kinase [Streptobacillus notomytis]
MKKVLLVGEAMMLFMAENGGNLSSVEKYLTGVSGAELNVCVGLTRLGFYCEYLTRLGNDPFGERIQDFLKKENIGMKYIEIDNENRTGLQLKSKVENGDPLTYYFRKGSAASKICKENIEKIDIDEFDLIHITGIPLALNDNLREAIIHLMERARDKGKYITFDPNLRPTIWENEEIMIKVINDVSKKADLILPGINEARILLKKYDIDEIVKEYKNMGINNIVIKEGEKGSHYYNKEHHYFMPCFKVNEVVDTVGAGDGFAVGIISGILDNLDYIKMLERANAIGAIQVGCRSDNEGLPNKEELDRFIKNNKKG